VQTPEPTAFVLVSSAPWGPHEKQGNADADLAAVARALREALDLAEEPALLEPKVGMDAPEATTPRAPEIWGHCPPAAAHDERCDRQCELDGTFGNGPGPPIDVDAGTGGGFGHLWGETRGSSRSAEPCRHAAPSAASPRPRPATKTPPKSPTGNDPITIFLRDQTTGEETYFSLRYRSTLRIVFTVFAERKGLSQDSLKFSFNGQSLTGYETPYSLGLEDRARIDVSIGSRR